MVDLTINVITLSKYSYNSEYVLSANTVVELPYFNKIPTSHFLKSIRNNSI